MNKKNHEGYDDPTAFHALTNVSREEKKAHKLVNQLKDLAKENGYVIENRIILKDKKTGRIFK